MNGFLAFLVPAAIVLTAIVLIIGLAGFARGGEFNRKHGNKMMQLRIVFQGVAVLLIVLAFALSGD